MKIGHRLLLVGILGFSSSVAFADEKTNLTIYSSAAPGSVSPDMYRPTANGGNGWMIANQIPGYAMIRQQRDIDLKPGVNSVLFPDVAALIDPTTVSFKSLTDPTGTTVLEQDYHFDLVNSQKLLERYLGQPITVDQDKGGAAQSYSGTLLSAANSSIVLQDATGKLTSLSSYSGVHFPELPGGLTSKPTLVWSVQAAKAGRQTVETSYQTEGITWWADYNATYTENKDGTGGLIDLGAWVSIVNKTGVSFDNAGLKLVAGTVHRTEAQQGQNDRGKLTYKNVALPEAAPAGFAEKAFFEFHLYTLGRPTTIPDNSTKQVELFPVVMKVPVEKQFVYNGASTSFFGSFTTDRDLGTDSNKKVGVYLKFKNAKEAGLGIPLPAGRIRVSKEDDADGGIEFIGEDTIDHTPKDEPVLIKMGDAFDIVGSRKQTDYRIDQSQSVIDETFEIALANHKDADVTVMVNEYLYRGSNWDITNASQKYEKVDSHTISFPVSVPKDGTVKLHYTVHYTK